MKSPVSSRRSALVGALILLCPIVAQSARGGGVTVITHGFNGNVTDWIIPMAERAVDYPGYDGSDFSCYQLEITSGGGGLVAEATLLGGVEPTASSNAEIFIKLDWSTLALGGTSSTEVAEVAAAALQSTTLIPGLGGRALAELPLHLSGHSRGGSVVSEMARELGEEGIWVDHLTLMDPVPVAGFGDAPVSIRENVLYADNFWQEIGGFLVPTGDATSGAYNRELVDLPGGYSSPHSDAHLWYHGTIELTTPATDTQADILQAQRDSWWTAPEQGGSATGFRFSRIGGGDRLSDFEPDGAGNGRISDGFNKRWDLGGGVSDNRSDLASNTGAWPNPIRSLLTSTGSVAVGETFELGLHHQSGASSAGEVSVRLLLDPDANPWNGNEVVAAEKMVAHTGPDAVAFTTFEGLVAPTVAPGSYRVRVEMSDAGLTRVLDAAEVLEVTPGVPPPMMDRDTLRIEGGLFRFDVLGTAGQEVVVLASENLQVWVEVERQVLTSDRWEYSDPQTASFPSRFYRVGEAGP